MPCKTFRITHLFSFSQRPLEFAHVHGPVFVFVEVVSDLVHVEFRQSGRVEGVLGDGDHHPGLLALGCALWVEEKLHDGPDAFGGARTQDDVVGAWGRSATVTLLDVRAHVTSNHLKKMVQ